MSVLKSILESKDPTLPLCKQKHTGLMVAASSRIFPIGHNMSDIHRARIDLLKRYPKYIDAQDAAGMTALMHAGCTIGFGCGCPMDKGCDPKPGRGSVVLTLINSGANVLLQDKKGHTADWYNKGHEGGALIAAMKEDIFATFAIELGEAWRNSTGEYLSVIKKAPLGFAESNKTRKELFTLGENGSD